MSMKNSIKYLIFGSLILALSPTDAAAYSYSLNASSIYRQAQAGNYEYFRILQRYPRAIDLMDNSGNTAYCIALRNRDMRAMNFLARQGANTRHSCVNKIMPANRQNMVVNQANTSNQAQRYSAGNSFFSDDKNIYYTAAGLAAAGGIIALLASSHHGGSGGGSVNPPTPSGDLVDMTPEEFKTDEYYASNLLAGINAAEAYSHIYQKDSVGNIFGHQHNSTESIEKIKVGVIDNGVFQNSDLAGDIAKTYNINVYNGEKTVWGHVASPTKSYYVISKDGKYFGGTLTYNLNTGKINISPWMNKSSEFELSEADVKSIASDLNLTFDIDGNFDFSLINDAGGSNPGLDLSDFDYSDAQSWSLPVEMNHGTHVTGIIAANKNNEGMHGVAFDNAEIYAASWDLLSSTNLYDPVKDMIKNNVKVINNSWGIEDGVSTATTFVEYYNNGYITAEHDRIKSYLYAAKNGAVWVQAAGNKSLDDGSFWTGMGQVDYSSAGYKPGEHEAPYIAVAALDLSTATSDAPSGKLASYSNKCGTTQDYCLAAPGSDVLSTSATKDGAIYMDGTSMGTPAVTGSIALLNGYYPWLSAQNIAYLLLNTTNNEGEYSNKATYGRGALDLNRAITQPLGTLGLATESDINTIRPANYNKLYLSGATQKQIANALPKTVVAFDELQRPFDYKTANLISETHGSNANFRNKVSHAAMSGSTTTIKDDKTGFSFTQTEALNKGGKQNLSSAEVVLETNDGSATRLYYAQNSKYMASENVLTPSTNPFLSMNEAYGAENTMKLSDISKFKLSLQTGENGMYERDYEQDRTSFTERSYAINAEYSFNLTDYLELSTLGGMLFEEDAMLGMNGQGGFAIRDGSTYYMGLKAALNLTPNLTLLAAYYRGYTKGQDATMLSLSDIETESYMLAGEYKLSPLHKVGLSLSSPLSVVRGRASFRYATGRDNYSDTVYMQKLTASLKPTAKEYDLGLYYKGAPQTNLNLLGKVETRFNADGEKGLTDYLGIVGMQYAFPK